MSLIKEEKVRVVTVGHTCDMCGKDCRTFDGMGNAEPHSDEFGTLEAYWGYHSDNRDGESWTADLCQSCFERVVEFIESCGGKMGGKHGRES